MEKSMLNNDEENDTISVRKIRIIVSDPFATESSSDDDNHRRSQKASSSKPRRIVHEILLNKNSGKEKVNTEEPGLTRTNLKKFLGAHQRKSGSWSAEIRDPFKKRRVWLGTFGTPDEASKVYAAKKLEFHERKKAQSCMNCTQTSNGSDTDMSCKSGDEISNCEDSGRTPVNLKEFPGVRQRRSGFWVARIHDPFKKRMVRLGTFRTPEKASKVYAAKKVEFRERHDAQSCMNHTRAASDGEEGNVRVNVGPIVTENLLSNCGNEISNTDESGSARTNLKAFRGVRHRRSGSWAAEIRDPFTKRRVWLGTWKTPEEASKVYAAKKLEFQERRDAQSCMNHTRDVSGSRIDMRSKSGEEGSTGLIFGSIARKILVNNNKSIEKPDTDKSRCFQTNLKKFQGFCQQKNGRWSEEIHDLYMNHKVNLGTFGTPAEASKVYCARKLEFRERQDAQSCMNGTRSPSVSGTNMSNKSGEEENAGLNGPILIDHNGFLLGQYSNLDDDLNISE